MRTRSIDGAPAGVPGRMLFVAGTLPPGPRMAIVGSRAALSRYRAAVPSVVTGAADAGFAVVSGGALGVDGDAHREALRQGVRQVAVLPLGSDRVYPPAHAALMDQLAAVPDSGVLFAVPAGTPAGRSMFASRNRLVVGLCSHLVVVQAGVPSGTLGTGKLALRRGLQVAVLPGSVGAADLAGRGARVLSDAALGAAGLARQVAQWLRGALPPPAQWPPHLHLLRRQLQAASSAGVGVDDLRNPLEGLVMLTEAETRGLVLLRSDGRYVAV